MDLRFTKMHGAGNDFVVLDALRDPAVATLDTAALRRLGDRHTGIGADQLLLVQPPTPEQAAQGIDFRYRIFNGATGSEVEHCGNGARCFVRYVRDQGYAASSVVRVATVNNVLELREEADGRVTVDMNSPRLDPAALPFDVVGLSPRRPAGAICGVALWPLDAGDGLAVEGVAVSMGNPHWVMLPPSWGGLALDLAPVAALGARLERHPRFPRRVNVGFLQPEGRSRVSLRVFERDAGETLACGTGACAAVVAGIALDLLDERVDVATRGGVLTIAWAGRREGVGAHVFMTGPAATVFTGEIAL
jgi:diaminopimelate epimerase